MTLRLVGMGAVLGASLAVGACVAQVDNRGNLPDPERVADIKPGQISKAEVEEILGSPSSIGLYGDEAWYYISKQTETLAFFAPEVTESQVLVVRFDSQGLVTGIETLGMDDRREVAPVDRTTPTSGNEITIFDQFLGNLGRFKK